MVWLVSGIRQIGRLNNGWEMDLIDQVGLTGALIASLGWASFVCLERAKIDPPEIIKLIIIIAIGGGGGTAIISLFMMIWN